MPSRCVIANALDYLPRTSNSRIGIGPHDHQGTTPRQRSNRRHQSCNYHALSSACAGQPSRPRLCSTSLRHAGLLRLQPVQSTGRNTLQTARLGFPPSDVEGQGASRSIGIVDATGWTNGRVLKAPPAGIGEVTTTDRRDVSRRFRIAGGASSAAPSPMIHGEVNAKLPRGASPWLTWFGGWFCRAPWHRHIGVPHRCPPSRVGTWPRHQEG